MSQKLLELLQHYNLSPNVIIFILSMIPVAELRGGIIIAKVLEIAPLKAYVICFLGNMLPIPFILIFIKQIFAFLKRFSFTRKIVVRLEASAMKKSEKVNQKQLLGLFFFVALPLPGTGGWTGALIASLLNIPIKKSFLAITFGVATAGILMIILLYIIPSLGIFGK